MNIIINFFGGVKNFSVKLLDKEASLKGAYLSRR